MFRKTNTAILVTAVLLAPAGALAGEQCPYEAEECVRGMMAKLEKRGWIGIEMEDDERGRIITAVVPGSPGERAGLTKGDVMVSFNGVELTEGKEAVYAEMNRSMSPGGQVTITVERGGERHDLQVTLAEIPRELLAQWIGQHMLDGHSRPAAPADGSPPKQPAGE